MHGLYTRETYSVGYTINSCNLMETTQSAVAAGRCGGAIVQVVTSAWRRRPVGGTQTSEAEEIRSR